MILDDSKGFFWDAPEILHFFGIFWDFFVDFLVISYQLCCILKDIFGILWDSLAFSGIFQHVAVISCDLATLSQLGVAVGHQNG